MLLVSGPGCFPRHIKRVLPPQPVQSVGTGVALIGAGPPPGSRANLPQHVEAGVHVLPEFIRSRRSNTKGRGRSGARRDRLAQVAMTRRPRSLEATPQCHPFPTMRWRVLASAPALAVYPVGMWWSCSFTSGGGM